MTECIAVDAEKEHELLRLAASAEQNSEHPLGRAIVDAAQEREIMLPTVDDFQSVTGGGVSGNIERTAVLVGKPAFLTEQGVQDVEALDDRAEQLQREGRTVIFVAVDGLFAGLLAVSVGTTPRKRE